MIPRRMHQIWLGPRPRPAEWMGTWSTQNPTFAYRVWDEAALDAFGLRNRQVFERFMTEGIFDGAADVARVEILHREGGIYLDADSIAVSPIDDGLLKAGFFAVAEPTSEHGALTGNACIGARAGHPVLERYLDAISRVEEIRPMWRLTGPGVLTEVLARSSERDIEILPSWSFYATSIDGAPVTGGAPFGRHLWSTTAERWGRVGGTPYPDFAGP
jgi:mannosyltransferase OCH1-like enzyme